MAVLAIDYGGDDPVLYEYDIRCAMFRLHDAVVRCRGSAIARGNDDYQLDTLAVLGSDCSSVDLAHQNLPNGASLVSASVIYGALMQSKRNRHPTTSCSDLCLTSERG